jgi:hypothetical protein
MDHRIEARIAALETEIASLKEAVADDVGPPTSDRRGMMKMLAASAVGAITGAVVLGAEPAAALPLPVDAAAADGDAVAAGMNNLSTEATGFDASGSSGVVAVGENGVGIIADGAFGNAFFPGGGLSPAGTAALPGILLVDINGNWWGATVDSDTDGQWRKLAGPSTAGQLHVLPSPVRVYDSRPGQAPIGIGDKFPTAVNAVRIIDTGVNFSLVPRNANAVLINLTITGPQTAGFATAWPTGPFPGTSSINFAALQTIAATTVVGCGPSATIQILANAITDFLVDVIGYYQ